MMIPFAKLVRKYKLKVRGIIHVGAHLMEEAEDYKRHKIENIIWIEANPILCKEISTKILGTNQKVFNRLISDKDNDEIAFYIANNGMSSSILALGDHKGDYPDIKYIDELKLITQTIKTLFNENAINPHMYNFINLDIQGVELKAIKGLGENLKYVDYIYTEVNIKQVYIGNDLMGDIDSYLSNYGFKRVETLITPAGWGDAFYVKDVPGKLHRLLIDLEFRNISFSGIADKILRKFKSQ